MSKDLQSAFDTFPEEVLVVAIIGSNGAERVWLADAIETPEQHEWAAKHLAAASVIAQRMQPNCGEA